MKAPIYPKPIDDIEIDQRMTRGQHEDTWGCWGYEYYSSLSITLSLLSLDRDDTDEEDYERYCVTRFAAELEEEPDNQDKEERKIAKVDKRAVTTF